jgi:hypothetical protein
MKIDGFLVKFLRKIGYTVIFQRCGVLIKEKSGAIVNPIEIENMVDEYKRLGLYDQLIKELK